MATSKAACLSMIIYNALKDAWENLSTAHPWFRGTVPHSARPPSSLGVEQTVSEHAHARRGVAVEHVDMEITAPVDVMRL